MKTQHTPGPWTVNPCDPAFGRVQDVEVRADGYGIATVRAPDVLIDRSLSLDAEELHTAQCELVANARLIAAAPELLAALEICAAKLALWPEGSNPDFFPSLKAARAAIAKAELATKATHGGAT